MSCHLSMWANIPLHNFLYLTVLNNVFFFSFCVIALTSSRFGYPFKLPPFSPQCHVCVKLSRLSFLIMCPKYFFCLFLLLCISLPPQKKKRQKRPRSGKQVTVQIKVRVKSFEVCQGIQSLLRLSKSSQSDQKSSASV